MEKNSPLSDATTPQPLPDMPVALPVTSNDDFTKQLLEEIEREAALNEQKQAEKPVPAPVIAIAEPSKSVSETPSITNALHTRLNKKSSMRVKSETLNSVSKQDFLKTLRNLLEDKPHALERDIQEANPFLPQELVAGSVPYIKGMEEDMVWNAAVQTCGTERIYFAYTVFDGRCWYLACPTVAMSSHPDSWCPLLAALPGNSEFIDKETVYIYEEAGIAAALRWDAETNRLQVYSGPSRSVLPKIQSMDASFVSIDSELATRYPWHNKNLLQEHLARTTVSWLVKSALVVSVFSLVYIVYLYMQILWHDVSLASAQRDTQAESQKLLQEATNALQASSYTHLFRIQELLDEIGSIGGSLLRYQVDNKGVVVWQAIVPAATPNENLSKLGARSIGQTEDGRIRIEGKR